MFTEPPHRIAVEVAERFADGLATKKELGIAASAFPSPDSLAADMAFYCASVDVSGCEYLASYMEIEGYNQGYADEQPAHSRFLRDIFGNPFRPATIDPGWLSSTVVSLATAIYEERAFDQLLILADALEDAGCNNAAILNHCRQPGEHVRGCWAVDSILKKK